MTTPPYALYETWEALEVSPLVHSRLYALEPQGIGTAQVESLTSYLGRLAVTHRVSLSNLIAEEIAPICRPPRTKASFFSANTGALLRVNDLSKELLWVLQRLTGRLDLLYLTILPWAQLMATQETRVSIAPGAVAVWRNNAPRDRWSTNSWGGVSSPSKFVPTTPNPSKPAAPIAVNPKLG